MLGIIPSLHTPFNEKNKIDIISLRKLIDHTVTTGCAGMLVGAVAGENGSLSFDEHRGRLGGRAGFGAAQDSPAGVEGRELHSRRSQRVGRERLRGRRRLLRGRSSAAIGRRQLLRRRLGGRGSGLGGQGLRARQRDQSQREPEELSETNLHVASPVDGGHVPR